MVAFLSIISPTDSCTLEIELVKHSALIEAPMAIALHTSIARRLDTELTNLCDLGTNFYHQGVVTTNISQTITRQFNKI